MNTRTTLSNLALATGTFVGCAGLANAQDLVNGTIVYYTGAPVTALGATSQDIIFNPQQGTASVTTGDGTDFAGSFDLEARVAFNSNDIIKPDAYADDVDGVLTSGNGENQVIDLAKGASIGSQYALTTSIMAGGPNVYLAGKNVEFLNKLGTTDSPFPNAAEGAPTSTTGYVGLTFVDDFSSNQLDYGWAEITVDPAGDVTLDAFAYDDSGAAILAGEVPEPASPGLILLSGSALALLARRHRKQAALA